MKKTAIILMSVLTIYGCSKEEIKPIKEPIVITPVIINPLENKLIQLVSTDANTEVSYTLKIYEKVDSTYINTITNYHQEDFSKEFINEVHGEFYFYLRLTNNSTSGNVQDSDKGFIEATIVYNGDTTYLKVDKTEWMKEITSKVYNE